MPLELSLASKSDLPSIVPIQFAAFHPTNRVHRLIYPSPVTVPSSVIEKTISRHLDTWEKDAKHVIWIVVRDTDSHSDSEHKGKGKIIAAAKYLLWGPGDSATFPESVTIDWVPSEKDRDPSIVNAGNGAADDIPYITFILSQFYGGRRTRIHGPALLLDILFTHPEYHKRGAGKMMVKWGLEKADQLGIKTYVEASPEGRRLYESCGFEMVEEVEIEGGDVERGGREEWGGYEVADWSFMERAATKKKD